MDKEKIKKTTEEVVDKSVEALSKAGKATKKFCKKMGLRGVNVKSDFQIKEIYKTADFENKMDNWTEEIIHNLMVIRALWGKEFRK